MCYNGNIKQNSLLIVVFPSIITILKIYILGNLRIRNVQIEDAGTYLCHGTDPTEKKPVSLQVTGENS